MVRARERPLRRYQNRPFLDPTSEYDDISTFVKLGKLAICLLTMSDSWGLQCVLPVGW